MFKLLPAAAGAAAAEATAAETAEAASSATAGETSPAAARRTTGTHKQPEWYAAGPPTPYMPVI